MVQHDKDVAFCWFCNVLSDGQSISGAAEHSWAIIDKNSSQMLLTQKMAKLDPATLSKYGYRCFASYFNAVCLLANVTATCTMALALRVTVRLYAVS